MMTTMVPIVACAVPRRRHRARIILRCILHATTVPSLEIGTPQGPKRDVVHTAVLHGVLATTHHDDGRPADRRPT